jgi:hypothetical protein
LARSRRHVECTGWPLAIGHVTGVRSFTVYRGSRRHERGTLGPATFRSSGYEWQARGNKVHCNLEELAGMSSTWMDWYSGITYMVRSSLKAPRHRSDEICEFDEHSCGLWAYHDGSRYSKSLDTTSGVIRGYGKTTIGERGFRASRADVEALVVRDRLMGFLIYPLWALFCLWQGLSIFISETALDEVMFTIGMTSLPIVVMIGFIAGDHLPLNLNVSLMREVRRRYEAEGVKVYSTRWLMLRRHPVDRQITGAVEE